MLGRTTKTITNYIDGTLTASETDTDQTTSYTYDTAGRLSVLTALNANGTSVVPQNTTYLYESPVNGSLVTSEIYPDSSDTDSTGTDQIKYTYDRLGKVLTKTDQRGVVHTFTYNPNGQLELDAATTIPTGLGIDTSVRSIGYTYDDLGRQVTVTSYANADGSSVVNQVKYVYDDWGNIVKTYQAHDGAVNETTTPCIQYVYEDGAVGGVAKYNRLTEVIYPSGETVYYLYPTSGVGAHLSRVESISADSSGTSIYASYSYLGSGTIVSISHPQVTGTLSLSYGSGGTYSGWDRFGRVKEQLWVVYDSGTSSWIPVDGYTYTYDRSSNVLTKTNVMNSSFNETYAYDGLDRLIDFDRGGANAQAWDLDSLGNWAEYKDGATTQERETNEANEITDLDTTGNDPTYDLAGNMTSAPLAGDETTVQYYAYNAWNKMTGVYGDSNRTITIALYEYDGLGRRIQKYTSASTLDTYLNESWQEVETRKNADPDAQDKYVYDLRYVDAPVARLHDDNTDGDLLDAGDNTLYYTQDANFNVMSLITTAGSVTERYVYTPYGMVTVLESNFSADADNKSDYGNVKLFQGVIQDAETLLYYSRNRYRHIELSWTQRDPKIYIDGYNLYPFVSGMPICGRDPEGTNKSNDLVLKLLDLEGRKDYDWIRNGNGNSQTGQWLWKQVQDVKEKLKKTPTIFRIFSMPLFCDPNGSTALNVTMDYLYTRSFGFVSHQFVSNVSQPWTAGQIIGYGWSVTTALKGATSPSKETYLPGVEYNREYKTYRSDNIVRGTTIDSLHATDDVIWNSIKTYPMAANYGQSSINPIYIHYDCQNWALEAVEEAGLKASSFTSAKE